MPTQLLLDIDDKHYLAVGKVAARWAYVEAAVDALIARLSGVPDEMLTVITVGQNMSFRIEALASLSTTIADASHRVVFDSLISKSRHLMAERNFVVHAVWLRGGPKGFGYLLKKNAAGARTEDWTPQKIEELAAEIADLAGNFAMALAALPSPGTNHGRFLKSHLQAPPEGGRAKGKPPPRSSRA